MVNTMDLGRGFLKLQEDNSRRSSSLFRQKPLEFNDSGLHYVTRINCGCGQCVPFRVKVEKDDGGLRIGKLSLATNCHLIIVIFGFFFLTAGTVLTALAYKEPIPDPDLPLHARGSTLEQVDSPSRQEGKVAGPIFIIVGSALVLMGFTLTALACKLNREAKRQLHLNRFTWETPPIQTPDIFNNSSSEHYATFANLDTFSVRSRELSTSSGGVGSRRDSSFTFGRQQQHPPPPLSTIAQAVPVGIFLFGDSTTTPKSPTIQVTDTSGFQEIELGSPTTESAPPSATFASRGYPSDAHNHHPNAKKQRSHSDGASFDEDVKSSPRRTNKNLNPNETPHSKPNLGLRPSLPIIPMFASPHYFSRVVTPLDARSLYVNSRSDEPFGSIASLSTSGDIACFPVSSSTHTSSTAGHHLANNIVMQPTPECDEESSTSSSILPTTNNQSPNRRNNANHPTKFPSIIEADDTKETDANANSRSNKELYDVIPKSVTSKEIISELPPINVNEFGSKVCSDGGGSGFRPKSILRQSKSEDCHDEEI